MHIEAIDFVLHVLSWIRFRVRSQLVIYALIVAISFGWKRHMSILVTIEFGSTRWHLRNECSSRALFIGDFVSFTPKMQLSWSNRHWHAARVKVPINHNLVLLITVASRDETLNGILICADFLLLSSCFLPLRMEKLSTKTHQLRDKKISNDSQKKLRRLRGIGNRTLN